MSTGAFEPRWPPQSPREALLSSPTGRQKIRQCYDRTSPSPSPLKKSSATTRLGQSGRGVNHESLLGDADDEEDEETLQLKLAAIEAKIKLKKLQQKKNKAFTSSSDIENESPQGNRTSRKENLPPASLPCGDYEKAPVARPKSTAGVQIPVSPQRKQRVAEEAPSPGRVLLGIDKGLKGNNVSLRRPQDSQIKDDDPFRSTRPSSSVSRNPGISCSSTESRLDQLSRPKTFSEKIAETRQQDKAQKERIDKVRKQRSTGFGIQQQEVDAFKSIAEKNAMASSGRPNVQAGTIEFSRDQILNAVNKPSKGLLHRSNTSADIRRSRAQGTPSSEIYIYPNASPEPSKLTKTTSNASKKRTRSLSPSDETSNHPPRVSSPETSTSLFEPFSSFHLSRRLLPHDLLARTLSGKHIFLLPGLLGAVKSPDYCLPDIPEPDHVVLATIASKSNPLTHKDAHKSTPSDNTTSISEAADSEQNTKGKYMVLTLTDLKWTVDLFLFTTAYTRFWKLTPGTVIALLNPDIMPPPPGRADTGRFSLKLSSSDDTVIEIGTSRDLGWCKSVRKDGRQCSSWIDKRHTEFCEFHVDVVVERTRRGRMEVQGMSAPFAPGGQKSGRTGHFGGKRKGDNYRKDDGFVREGAQYDHGSGSRYFVGPSLPGRSAAQLLDAEGAIERGGSKEERVRKRLAEREKEKEIARKLGEGGNGAGSEYLRLKHGGEAKGAGYLDTDSQALGPVDATSLGLLGNKARNVHLSPIKKRKGSALYADGERKKTRFVTDKGIKEAGRESFGSEMWLRDTDHDDVDGDDDGLDVV